MLEKTHPRTAMMNVFSAVVLAALLLEFVLERVAGLLNLKALKLEVPPPLEGLYRPEEYRKSQEYVRATARFGLASSAFGLVVLLAFWFFRGFNYFDTVIRSWTPEPLFSGLLYIGILALGYGLLMLPFGIYATFVIEQRFGFNRTTWRVFLLDRVKGLGLALLLGGALLAGVMALFQYAGAYAWLYCWAGVVLVALVVQYVAPNWIMPLFNKFIPMPEGDLRDAVLGYTRSVGFPLKNVYIVDGSRRSSRANAFFTGFGRNKRIALFDTLIARHTTAELVAILAHEVGHHKKKHMLQSSVIGTVHTGILLFLLSVFLKSQGLYQAFYVEQPSVYTGLLLAGLLYTPVEMVFSMLMQMISRHNEFAADRYAAETIPDRHSMIDALKKLFAANLSNLTPHPFYVFLTYSHPPLLQRLQAIQEPKRGRQGGSSVNEIVT